VASESQGLDSSCWAVQDNTDVRSGRMAAALKISCEMMCYINIEAGGKQSRVTSGISCEAEFFSLAFFFF